MSDRQDIKDNAADERESKSANPAAAALQSEALHLQERHVQIVGDRAQLLDSRRATPDGTLIGPTDPNKEISVTLMVRSKASDNEFDQALKDMAEHKIKPLNDAKFTAQFGADPEAMGRVLNFAKTSGLKAESVDPESGRVVVKGTVKDFSTAFGTTLNDYKCQDGVKRQREGSLLVPRALGEDLDGVFGLDERTQAHPHAVRFNPAANATKDGATPHKSSSFLPPELAIAYNFPTESMGAGQSAAILEFGGGLDLADNAKYYSEHNLKQPEINVVSVDGQQNVPGSPPDGADGEIALDSQVIGSIAPDAKQMLVFSQDNEQGWIDAITRATFTQPSETPNSAISISWGDPESRWTPEQIRAQGLAFKKAALKGISVFAASGDTGATNGSSDGKVSTNYPSSDPYVTSSGGTRLSTDAQGKIKDETTWNDWGAGGGGISDNIPVPDYQVGLNMPPNANGTGKPGRGLPDMAADASPSTGYVVRVNGDEQVIGGTSAVSPLFTAMMMRINGALGHSAGFLNPFLYKNGNSGIFHDITTGNINGYDATKGWDAATGWGSPDGKALLDALRKQGQ